MHGHDSPNAEATFQMSKSAVTQDIDIGTELIQTVAADKAKLIGRNVQDLNLGTWANNLLKTIEIVVLSKMQQGTKLQELLLQSNVAILVEASSNVIWEAVAAQRIKIV